ncbi:MAG: tetratricopeptide repeat protein, partial [Planctomycetota bacterium]|nr:tetratricopeptide repeat protein [Planctomycetota bacterium]
IEKKHVNTSWRRYLAWGGAAIAVVFLGLGFSWQASVQGFFGPTVTEQRLKDELQQLEAKVNDQKPVDRPENLQRMTYAEKVLLLLRQNKKGQELELELAALDKDIRSPKDLIECSEMCGDLNLREFEKSFLARAERMFPKSNRVLFKAGAIVKSILSNDVQSESRKILASADQDAYYWAAKAIVSMQESGKTSSISAERLREILSYTDKAIEMGAEEADFYTVRANLHFILRDFQNALKDYGTAIELRPRNALYYLFRGNLRVGAIVLGLQRSGRIDRPLLDLSLSDAEMARSLDGRIVAVDILLGRLHQFANRNNVARSMFLSVVGNPLATPAERSDGLMGVGGLYEREEKYSEAADCYRRAFIVGKDRRSKRAMARAQVLNKDYGAALDTWIEIAASQGDPRHLLFLARCYLGLNNPLKALEELRKIRRGGKLKGPLAYDYCYYSGLAMSKVSLFSEASVLFLEAVKIFPGLIDPRIELIHCYVQLKNYSGAQNQLREAKGFHPKALKLVIAEISLQLAQRDFDAAFGTYQRASQANFDKETLLIELARIFQAQGNLNAAGKQLNVAIRMNEKNPKSHYILGEILSSRNQSQAAYLAFSRAYTLNYPDLGVQMKLGALAIELNDYLSALLHYNLFLKRTPTYNASAYLLRAEVYSRLGKFSAALEDCNETLRGSRATSYPLGYFARARIYSAMKNRQQAIADYRRFLDLSKKDDRWAREKNVARVALESLKKP